MALFKHLKTLYLFLICSLHTALCASTCYSCSGIRDLSECTSVEQCADDQVCYVQNSIGRPDSYDLGCRDVQSVVSQSTGDNCSYVCKGDLCNHRGCGLFDSSRSSNPICYHCITSAASTQCHSLQRCRQGEVCASTRYITGTNVTYFYGCLDSEFCSAFMDKRSASHVQCMSCCQADLCNVDDCMKFTPTTPDKTTTRTTTPAKTTDQTKTTAQPSSPIATTKVTRTTNATTAANTILDQSTIKHTTRIRTTEAAFTSGKATLPTITSDKETVPASPSTTTTVTKVTTEQSQITPQKSIDGGWGGWTSWSTCPYSCGRDGIQHRLRRCDNPAPQHGGLRCVGSVFDTRICHTRVCCTGPPTITFIEPNTTSTAGDTLTLRCHANNYDTLQWDIPKIDGRPYPANVFEPSGSTEVIVNSIYSDNIGPYICIAKNSCGLSLNVTYVDVFH